MNKIMVPITMHEEITADEYRKRCNIESRPAFPIGRVLTFKGEYSTPTLAAVVGCEMRAGGWFYHGATLGRNTVSRVTFAEKDVLVDMEADAILKGEA